MGRSLAKNIKIALGICILILQIDTFASPGKFEAEKMPLGSPRSLNIACSSLLAKSSSIQSDPILKDIIKSPDALKFIEKNYPDVMLGLLIHAKNAAAIKTSKNKDSKEDLLIDIGHFVRFLELFGENGIRGDSTLEAKKAGDAMLSQIAKSVTWSDASARRLLAEDFAKIYLIMKGRVSGRGKSRVIDDPKSFDEAVAIVLKDRGLRKYLEDCG